MKKSKILPRLFVLPGLLVILLSAFGFQQTFASEPTRKTDRRHVPLDGQSNFRDIGGYKTVDGRSVKWGQIYRSGELPRLSDKDVSELKKLDIATVISFLSKDEIEARGEDKLPAGVQEISAPISGGVDGDLAKVVLEARKTADFSKVPVELNAELHRLLTGDDTKEQYAMLLRQASDPANRPLVFHCSHGVHRTGTATAILLSALGVPWETIREDYLLSNQYRNMEVKKRLIQLRELAAENQGIPADQVDMTNMNAFYVLESAYIDASLDAIRKQYGTMDAYLRQGFGLSDAELKRLQSELLD